MFWSKLAAVLASALILFLLFGYLKRNPQAFSKKNLEKSLFVLGILALGLIAFIALLVVLVK